IGPCCCSSASTAVRTATTSTSSVSPRRAKSAFAPAMAQSRRCCDAMWDGWSTTAVSRPTTGSTSMTFGGRARAVLLAAALAHGVAAGGRRVRLECRAADAGARQGEDVEGAIRGAPVRRHPHYAARIFRHAAVRGTRSPREARAVAAGGKRSAGGRAADPRERAAETAPQHPPRGLPRGRRLCRKHPLHPGGRPGGAEAPVRDRARGGRAQMAHGAQADRSEYAGAAERDPRRRQPPHHPLDRIHRAQRRPFDDDDHPRHAVTAGERWAVGAWLAFLAAGVWIVAHTTFTTDVSAFLPRSPTPEQQVLVEQLREGVVSRLVLVALEGTPPASLAQASKSMAAELRQDASFVAVENGDGSGAGADRDFLWRLRYLLSPAVSPERFSAAGLRERLEETLRLLDSPAGTLVRRVAPSDPTGELLQILEHLETQSRPATREGVRFSRDGRRALLLAQTRAPGYDVGAQEHAIARIQEAFSRADAGEANLPG